MSFSENRGLTWPQMLGCVLVALTGVFVTTVGLLVNALGGSPAREPRPFQDFIVFPGSAIFFLALGACMIWLFQRANDRK